MNGEIRTDLPIRCGILSNTQMKPAFVIRQAGLADIPEVLRQRREMYRDMGHRDEARLDGMIATSAKYLHEAMPAGSFHAWLAQTSGADMVGGGAVIVSPWLSRPHSLECRQASILNVYTYPRYRRQGVAREVMQTMIGWCREQGFAYVSLHASEDGKPLYEELGFEPTTEMRLKLR
jgi:GNAT superfamily N-acetyltransferase